MMDKMGGWTTVFLVLGAFFTVLGAIYTGKDQARDANALKLKSDQLATKSDEIARLTRVNANMATGGDSFCFLRLLPGLNGHGYLNAEHRGDYTVYDATANVIDISAANVSRDFAHPEQVTGRRYTFKIGNVISGWIPDSIGEVPLPEKGDLRYIVLIQARNGDVTEEINGTRLENGKWNIRTTVTRVDPTTQQGDVVYEDPPR